MDRYIKNQNSLSDTDMLKLKNRSVCIVGCGGLGGYVIEHLARIGLGNLTVVDGDTFDSSNLNRQLLSTELNIGSNKALEAKKRISLINNSVNVRAISTYIDKDNVISILEGHHVIVDSLDNIETRLLIEENATKLNIPLIHGAIAGFYGQVSTIFPHDDTFSFLYKSSTENDLGIEKTLGNLPFTASIVSSIQSSEVIKVLLNKGSVLRKKILYIDLLTNNYDLLNLE